MSKHNLNPINKILKNKNLLTKPIFRHVQRLQQLTSIIHARLPPSMFEHCQVANCTRTELALATHSPGWSTRLRYHSNDILDAVNRETGMTLRKVRIIIIPPKNEPVRPKRSVQKPSAASITLLQETAQHIQHPKLQEALMRLSRHMETKQKDS